MILLFKETVPEIETHIKLLCTAITRCSKRLFFAETAVSIAGDAFCKWATITAANSSPETLAVKQILDSVERMAKTTDEWRSSGTDFGIEAESTDDVKQATMWIGRAVYDFKKSGDTELECKSNVHQRSVEFRCELAAIHESKTAYDKDHIEREASSILDSLLRMGLLFEARKVITFLSPLLGDYSKKNCGAS